MNISSLHTPPPPWEIILFLITGYACPDFNKQRGGSNDDRNFTCADAFYTTLFPP